jgi:hypothetical protein
LLLTGLVVLPPKPSSNTLLLLVEAEADGKFLTVALVQAVVGVAVL